MRPSIQNYRLFTLSVGLVLVVALGVVPTTLAESVTQQETITVEQVVDLLETEPAQSSDSDTSKALESFLPTPTELSTCPLPPPPPPTSCTCGGCCECNRCWNNGSLAKCLSW